MFDLTFRPEPGFAGQNHVDQLTHVEGDKSASAPAAESVWSTLNKFQLF